METTYLYTVEDPEGMSWLVRVTNGQVTYTDPRDGTTYYSSDEDDTVHAIETGTANDSEYAYSHTYWE